MAPSATLQSMDLRPVLRFAPSPNGELHLGHALSALTGYEMATRLGGRFLVRIEDIDLARSRPEYIESALDDLHWLGVRWEDPVLRQSGHFADYRAAAARLEDQGLLYPCFATRGELAETARACPGAIDPDGAALVTRAPRSSLAQAWERRRAGGEPHALRLDMARAIEVAGIRTGGEDLTFVEIDSEGVSQRRAARPEMWGDAVLVRKDVPASYHLAVVVDDARQGVTHVTRGRDLLAATDLHRLLQRLLGLPEPLYHHHRLITDSSGRKLSKSARDVSLRALRKEGVTPAEIRRLIALG